jgi:cAMP phosphodiesterase
MFFTVQQEIFVLMYTCKLFTLVFDIQKDNCELNHLQGALISSGSIKEHVAPKKKTITDTPSYISSGINQPIHPANSGLSY